MISLLEISAGPHRGAEGHKGDGLFPSLTHNELTMVFQPHLETMPSSNLHSRCILLPRLSSALHHVRNFTSDLSGHTSYQMKPSYPHQKIHGYKAGVRLGPITQNCQNLTGFDLQKPTSNFIRLNLILRTS